MLVHQLIATTLVVSRIAQANSETDDRFATIQVHQAPGQINLHAASQRAFARKQGNVVATSTGRSSTNESFDAGFWYGKFKVGRASGLSLLIDTGSSDVAVNPGRYKPSSSGRNLGRSRTLGYITTQENGCGRASVAYTAWQDAISLAGFVSPQQVFGNVTATPPPDNGTITQFPRDGIVGFSGTSASTTQIYGTPFFQNLCNVGAVSSCRFGLAYGTSGRGQQVLGTVATSLYSGNLSTTVIDGQWEATGNVVVNGRSFLKGSNIIFDSGTANVIGSQHDVKALFAKLGIQAVMQNLPGCAQTIFGYYKCNAPPRVGFSFDDGRVFDIEPSAFKLADNGNNNCTSIITGMNFAGGSSSWLVGQAWFQGKYVDHNSDAGTMGFATLINKAG